MWSKSHWVFLSIAVLLLAGCQRGSQTAEKGGAGSGKPAAVLELGCVPADCFAAIVIHPRQIFQSPQAAQSAEVKKLLESEGYQEVVKQIGFDFRDLEEVTILVFAPPSGKQDVPAPAMVLRFVRPIDRDQVIGKIGGKEYTRSEQTHAGKTYTKFSPPGERKYARARCFFAPDDRTIVFVEREEELLKKMLSAKGAEGLLADALRRADISHEVVGVAVVQPVQSLVGEVAAKLVADAPAEFADLKSLVGRVKGGTLAADVFGDPMAKGTLQTDSPDTATKLLPMAQKWRERLLQDLQFTRERRANLKGKPLESQLAMEKAAEEFLGGLSLSQRDSELEATVRMKNPELAFWLIRGPIEAQKGIKPILARMQVSMYRPALQMYELDVGSEPTTKQGLEALLKRPADLDAKLQWRGPYIERLEKDPWGRDYQYRFPAKRGNPRAPEIWSNGPDGKSDTPDDIGSWDDDEDSGPARGKASAERVLSGEKKEPLEPLPPLDLPKEPPTKTLPR